MYIDAVAATHHRARRLRQSVTRVCLLLAVPLGVAAWSPSGPAGSATTTSTKPSGSKSATSPTSPRPLRAPKTSFAQDAKFFTDVGQADPALITYQQQYGNTALRALLTDGSAFCALVRRGGGINAALVAEAEGARSTEAQTNLPLSVTTFNTIESVALLTLCPSEQKRLPASVRSKIRRLGAALAQRPG